MKLLMSEKEMVWKGLIDKVAAGPGEIVIVGWIVNSKNKIVDLMASIPQSGLGFVCG